MLDRCLVHQATQNNETTPRSLFPSITHDYPSTAWPPTGPAPTSKKTRFRPALPTSIKSFAPLSLLLLLLEPLPIELMSTTTSSLSPSFPAPRAEKKIAKRKSRAKQRAPTACIDVDPENFRALVQQMTGPKFGDVGLGLVIRPEPKRRGFLPTLETSGVSMGRVEPAGLVRFGGEPVLEDEDLGFFDVESFLSLPTLESWVM